MTDTQTTDNGRQNPRQRQERARVSSRSSVVCRLFSVVCHRSSVICCLLVSGALAACTNIAAEVRRHTYPPDFQYITHEQMHSTMWELADSVRALDAVMRQPGPMTAERRADIESRLRTMLDTTTTLQSDGRPTNHPLLSEHVDRFRRDVTLALAGVEADPPNYYLVGSVSGACLTCHGAD